MPYLVTLDSEGRHGRAMRLQASVQVAAKAYKMEWSAAIQVRVCFLPAFALV
jgi:hypothetical protein